MLLVFSALVGYLPSPAEAAKVGTCAAFSVSTGRTTYRRDQTRTIPADRVGDRIRVDGRYIEFNVRSRDFAALQLQAHRRRFTWPR